VVLLQYSRRKSLVSRLWLLGIPISIAVMIAVIPYKRIVTGYFPLAEPGREAIARFSLDPDLIFTGGAASGYRYRGKDVQLQFPILIAGMPEDSFIEVRAIRLQLGSPTGTVWDSEWNSNYTKLLPGRTRVWPEFNIPQSVYEKNTSMPVRAKIWLGMNVYRLTRATTVTFGQSEFLLPNGERCARRAESGELTCLAPVSLPSLRLITADLPTRRCQPPFSNPDEAFSASSAFQAVTGNDSGTEPMLSPIQEFNITLTRPHTLENDETRTPLCQGLPFAISTPEFRFSYGAEVEMKQTVLSDYLSDFSRKIERRKSVPKGLHAERIAAPAIRRRSHAVGGSE
jgi:hypothetical protein